MRWWSIGVLIALLLGALMLAFPVPTQAQASAETVTIPVTGMT